MQPHAGRIDPVRGPAALLILGALSLAAAPALAQTHTTGIAVTKGCPIRADNGTMVQCTTTLENQDPQHGVLNLAPTNTVPFPGGSTSAISGCASTLAAKDGTPDSGPDFTSCTFDELVSVAQCNLGVFNNSVTDQVSATGNDADPTPLASGGFGGLPVSGSATTTVFVNCCGDGAVNQASETCDPPGQPGGSNGNLCRSDCTVCGDGLVQTGEDCDDGNGVDDDGCDNDCTVSPFCGDGVVDAGRGETCDPPGQPSGQPNECRSDCTFCGDGVLDASEECDDGNNTAGDGCSAECTNELQPIGCRITAGGVARDGGVDLNDFADITKATFGGQVGAPCGCNNDCFDTFDHIQGNWQHSRKGRKGSFLAKDYNSLVCGCDGEFNGVLCNPDGGPGGPEPRPAPANMACFSGIGSLNNTSGRRTTRVAFRVEVEDRSEPGVGKSLPDDVYRIRIWIPEQGETVDGLAATACCTHANPAGRAPNIDDGGSLVHGNIQIHPQLPNTLDGTCPVPTGTCQVP
jgi:cysteine-rich repeat protein